jgi:hypothetical protein
MKVNCGKSCSSCDVKSFADVNKDKGKPGCENKNELCGFWKSLGECEKNGTWMKKNCQLSCGAC